LKTVTSKDAFCCISDILNSIVTKEKTKGSFSFNAADAVSNSRSSVTSFNTLNAVKWKTFKEFGRYAYFVYLPDPVLGVNDINNPDDLELHRTLLSKIADDTYTEQRRLTSISYLAWCDRYILVIENRSRRFAACAYLAKSGDEYFNKPFDIDIYTQNIDFDKISELDSIVDTYALIADNKYHNVLTQLIHDYDVPAGVFRPKWNRDYLGYDVRVYFLLKDEFIEKTRLTTNDYSEYADHYLKSRAPLKQQFDVLKDEGLCVSFSDMVKNLRDAWTVTTNNQSK
jgi:hypothetical protein